jgi:hypothetical protein
LKLSREIISPQAERPARKILSRKGAKDAKFGENSKFFSLRALRLGAKNFVDFVLLNILSARI